MKRTRTIALGYQGAEPGIDPDEAFSIVIKLPLRNISDGEMEEVKRSMPADIQKLWPETPLH